MKKQFCFSAMICVFLSVFVFSVSADYYQPEQNAKTTQSDKQIEAQNKNTKAESARSLMQTLGSVYDQNVKDINSGKRLTLGSVFQGAAMVTVAYFSGGSTLSASVPSAISTAVRALGLAGSINASSELESAYESAISELQTRIWEASAAIARYKTAWDSYSLVVSGHNSSNHGGTYSYLSAHTISAYQPPSLNESLPSFACPGGSCGLSWSKPSKARTEHYGRCGTLDDPYDTWLGGCYTVYYTCNSSDNARHKPQDCGLSKWIKATHGWTETACPGDYRKCTQTQTQRDHSTLLTGVNVTSTCGGSRPSAPSDSTPPSENPVVSPPPPTPPPSPTYHACGEHETSVSGDHSLQASCSSTDSNGNSCTVTNFYACQSHTHVYPAPPTVSCGRSACTETVSSANEHRVGPCSACGGSYWSCGRYGSYWENRHRERTCRRSGCGNTWRRCQSSTPNCNALAGSRCWAR